MKTLTASLPLPTGSSRECEVSTTQHQAEYAAERGRLLFGCYRKGDANDPETYVAAITAILAEYEPEVIKRVTDPRKGIARKLKWMPSVAEISDACEAARAVIRAEQHQPMDDERRKQIAEEEVRRQAEVERDRPRVLAKIAEWRKQQGIPPDGLPRRGNRVPGFAPLGLGVNKAVDAIGSDE